MVNVKTNLRLLLFVGAVLLASSSVVFAQAVGDYGTVATGKWSSLSTWKEWDGTGWNTTPTAVPSGAVNVYINAGDTVTVDVADSVSDSLIVNGYVKDVAGLKTDSTVIVNNGATYDLAHDGSSSLPGLPTATWETGSNCLITGGNGTITSTTNFNANQNFYNFTVNAAVNSDKNLDMHGDTISGNVVINNTGSAKLEMTSPSSSGARVITLKGDLFVTNGVFTPDGSGSSGDIIVNDYGNVTVTAGNFAVSRGSGPLVKWNFYGDSLSISNAETQNSSKLAGTAFVFAGDTTQYLRLYNVKYSGGGMPVIVDTGATLDMGYSVLGGEGIFTVDSGAGLATQNPGGIDSTIQATGTVTLSTGGSYVFNGIGAQVTGSNLPTKVGKLIVDNAGGVTLSHSVNVADSLVFMSGKLMLDTNYVMAAAVSGASASSYAVTDSASSSFKVAAVGSSTRLFPVGTTAEGYSPVWISNSGTVDTFSVAAAVDTSPAAGIGRVNVKWNVAESQSTSPNCTLTFGWTQAAENSAFSAYRQAYAYIYNESGTSYTQAGTGSYTSQMSTSPYTLARSGITTLGSFVVGKFVVNLAAQVGDYGTVVASGNWDSLSTWKQWNGSAWATTPTAVPEGIENVFINKGDTVTVTGADSVGGSLIVDGYLKDEVGLKTGGTVVFDSTGTFDLAHDGGSNIAGIPSATWQTGSTCLITGKDDTVSSTEGFNANQNFYNFLINATFSSNKDLGMYDNTISGTFVVNSNSSSQVRLTSPGAGSPNTITIKGPLYLKAGEFTPDGSGSPAIINVDDYGNIFVTGGDFSVSRGSGPTVNWNFYGDTLSISNAQTKVSGNEDAFVFAKKGKQYLIFNNVSYSGGGIPMIVDTGATLYMGTSTVGGKGMFIADTGATLVSADTAGLDGNIQAGGTISISSGASVVYDGAVPQITGVTLPSTIENLTIDNPKGVTLSSSVSVNEALAMNSGILMLDTNNVTAKTVTGGSAGSYVSTDSSASYLKIPNVGSSKVMFPVGTESEGYSPVWITNGGTTDAYMVNVAMDTTSTSKIGRVNVKYNIGEGTPGGSKLTLALGWMKSAENSAFASNSSSDSKIYLSGKTGTVEVGGGTYTTQLSNEPYSVSASGIDTVGAFVVGNFTPTGVEQSPVVPAVFQLYQNYPNPFNPTTKIEFTVAKKGETSLTIYDILGQKVATLFDGQAEPGKKYMVQFDGSRFASGVYFSVLRNNSNRQIKKMIMLK